jgi:hypothetical protein
VKFALEVIVLWNYDEDTLKTVSVQWDLYREDAAWTTVNSSPKSSL